MQVLCPLLVGREAELARLEGALAAAASGRGGVLMLAGEAGTGKTRLAREAKDLARARGYAVLAGRAVEGAAAPYRPLAEALASAVRRDPKHLEAAELAPFRAVLGRLVPEWRSSGALQPDTSAVAVGESLLRVMGHLGKPGCLMILEDLHWADPDSLAVIEYLADNLGSEPVLLLVSLRSEEGEAAHRLAERLQARRSLVTLELPPLDAAETAVMTRFCLGASELPDELTRLVWARSEGVPFLVEEVLAALVSSGALQKSGNEWVLSASAEHLVPETFVAATHRRLASLGGSAARILRAASVLGAAFDWQLLTTITGLGEDDVLDGLRRAVEAKLLLVDPEGSDPCGSGFHFRHALTAEALRAELLPPERTALAKRALDALVESDPRLPGPACEMAASLAEAAGERERAASYLLKAADRAVRLGALATAEARLERARTLASQPATRVAVVSRLSEVLTLAGRSYDALRVGDDLLALLDNPTSAEQVPKLIAAHFCLARSATRAGRPALAEEHLRACQDLMAKHNHNVDDQARLELERGEAALLRADSKAAASAARAALAVAGRPEVLCEGWILLGRALRIEDLDGASEAFEQARFAAKAPRLAIWRMLATHELGTIDLYTTNRQDRLHEARELAEVAGAFGVLAAVELHLAVAADLDGRPEEAMKRAKSCVEIARRVGLPPLVAIGLGVYADALAAGGARQEVERLAGEILGMEGATPDARAAAWGALARNSLCSEQHERALAELEESTNCVRGQGCTTGPGPYYGYRALLVALHAERGGSVGDSVVAEVRALGAEASGWNRGLLACAEAVLAGRRGDKCRAEELAALGEQILSPFPGYAHLGFRLLAQAAVEDGWGEPARWLSLALGFAEERGLGEMASVCRGLSRRAGVPLKRSRQVGGEVPVGLEGRGISPRELEVLRLVGQGCANSEIAARLYLSVRTVEKHVESLLRKTALSRRTQLAALCARMAEKPEKTAPL